MDLSYIPSLPTDKEQAIAFYESKAFVNKGSNNHNLVLSILTALRKLPDEAFTEKFEKFSAADVEELVVKFNMRSYAYADAINQSNDVAQQVQMREHYAQFKGFLEFTGRVLREKKIEFPCVIDIRNASVLNNKTLE